MKLVEKKNYHFNGMAPVGHGDEFITRDPNGKIVSIERVVRVHPDGAETPRFFDAEVWVPAQS
jgi:hypothetical protein